MTTFDISDKAKQAMSGSLSEGDGVKLPFSAAIFWAVNGKPELAQVGGVQYFGGWASAQEDLVAHMHGLGIEIPPALALHEFVGKDGNYMAYTSRAIAVAPIVYRKRNANEGVPNASYRSHVQLLGYGAVLDNGVLKSLGPVVITGKGYQAGNITKAFNEWERKSAEARKAHANGADAKFFFLPIGTFGDKPSFVLVGGKAQSKITPIEPQIPDPVTEAHLKARFVGSEVADKMAEMREQAAGWVADWSTKKVGDNTPPPPDNWEGADETQYE